MSEIADVYRAIRDATKALSRDGISKDKKNEAQGYRFRGIDDVYNALSAVLAGAELCILPRMTERHQEERQTARAQRRIARQQLRRFNPPDLTP